MQAPAASFWTEFSSTSRPVWFGAALCLAAAVGLQSIGDLALRVEQVWAWSLLCLVGCGLVVWRVQHAHVSLWVILITAALIRLILLPTEPSLSEDIYRYLWDGHVQNAGINPYAHAPDSEAVAHLRNGLWSRINHRQVPTVYPPFAQWIFAGVTRLGGGSTSLKFVLLLFDAITICAIIGLLRQRHRDPAWVSLYALHPLPLLEIAGSGHVDAIGIGALMAGLFWLGQSRRWLAAAGLAAATLAKLIPVSCAVAFWRHWRPDRHGWSAWIDPRPRVPFALTAGLIFGGYAVFLADGTDIFRGLQTYALKWRFNDPVFSIVYDLLRERSLTWDDQALLLARNICGALWFGWMLWVVRWRDPLRISFGLLGAYIVLSPTVHPWYLLWVLPFLSVFPRPAWILWSWSILLSYEVLTGYRQSGIWAPSSWVWWAQYAPFFLLLAVDCWRAGSHRWQTRSAQNAPKERSLASDV